MPRHTIILATALVLGSAAVAAGPFKDVPAGPHALPGDVLPPFGIKDEAGNISSLPPLPPGMKMPGPGGPPDWTATGPGLAAAQRLAQAAVRICGAHGYRVGASVIDSGGRARAMLEADGSDGSHVFVAMRKAEVALAFGEASSAAQAAVLKDPSLASKVTPAMFVEGGAVPLRRGGRVIGAIGVSGAMGAPIGHADEVCAAAAAGLLR